MTSSTQAMPEGRAALAEAIAQSLEIGAPLERGAALSDFRRLFAENQEGPELGLAFDSKTGDLTALPLDEAFSSGCFIPFDFDAPAGPDPRTTARMAMLILAASLRGGGQPAIQQALDRLYSVAR
jgi:hypothetical protein